MSKRNIFLGLILGYCILIAQCHNAGKPPAGKDIASSPEDLDRKTTENIRSVVDFAMNHQGKIDDSISLVYYKTLQGLYDKNEFASLWSSKEKWNASGDSLLQFIQHARLFGLFPDDYHGKALLAIATRIAGDSLAESDRKDAALWSRADLMLTDAFVHMIKDIKLGRLGRDSITLRKDSVLSDSFYAGCLQTIQKNGSLEQLLSSLEPKVPGYQALRAAIPSFLDSADDRVYTVVPSASKGGAAFNAALQKRLFEGGFLPSDSVKADSAQLAEGVKKFQRRRGMAIDGKVGEATLRMLNLTDAEKFVRIAISLDRYKMLPEQMPDRYVWVNLPSFYMQLRQDDSVKITSKIICGKPSTRTPVLTSAISEMITYPQWTIPTSIIVKEILPAVKKNPGYLAKKGFSLVDGKGDEVDPFSVNWSKYSKGIPYRVVQGSGDANALGIMKFNFNNKYAVYLHDTNQRYLFASGTRDLSHGCVRVQEWQKLTDAILDYDSLNAKGKNFTRADSVRTWLKKKEKKSIAVHNRLPVFIRYITCEGKNGRIVFYDDMYGEDKMLRAQYFAGK